MTTLRDTFERSYASVWAADRGYGTPEELAAEIRKWRSGETYPDDMPRLRFGWEAYQWAVRDVTEQRRGVAIADVPSRTIPTDGWKQEYDLLYRSDEKGFNRDEIWVKQFGGARTMVARKDGAAELLALITGAPK